MKAPSDLLRGTVEMLVLRTLSGGPRHGYGIARWIQETTDQAVVLEDGSLYPALYRMERQGWIDSEWRTSELGRRAKYYELTREGRARLAAETANWLAFSTAVSKVLRPLEGGA